MKKLILLMPLIVCSCSALNAKFGLKDDNIIEEAIEKKIENKIGLDIDLTPSSPELKEKK